MKSLTKGAIIIVFSSKTLINNQFLDLTCIGQVNLTDYPQWADEDGYWLGEYTFMDGNGDPLYDPDYWNYPYDHYKGFIAGSVDGGSYSQRNVFLYPPQTVERCALDDQVI